MMVTFYSIFPITVNFRRLPLLVYQIYIAANMKKVHANISSLAKMAEASERFFVFELLQK